MRNDMARVAAHHGRWAGLSILLLVSVLGCSWSAGSGEPCATADFNLRADFAGGALGECAVTGRTSVRLALTPENEPINPSPWYSFVVEGNGTLDVAITYGEHDHRYQPKISEDGVQWRPLEPQAFTVAADKKQLSMTLQVKQQLYVSAQENLNGAVYDAWLDALVARYAGLERFTIGSSVAGRPIWAAQTNPAADNVLVFVGRQHPPEVTGAIAMLAFIERLLEYHPDSCSEQPHCQFYTDTNIVFVPLLNPDGVAAGHWRHNLNGVDINRDWRAGSQPEVQAVLQLIDQLSSTASLRLLFDFHSTYRDVFYTQGPGYKTSPADFAQRWLDRAAEYGTYPLENAQRRTTLLGTSKNYIHRRFGVPGITYELGDETPRQDIRRSARSLARAMVEEIYPYQPDLDLLIRDGTLIDGTGRDGYVANVGVHGDRIVYLGTETPAARRVIDATGLYVTPGFIDPRTHTIRDLRNPQTALNAAYLSQGVTTVFTGNDGDGRDFNEEVARLGAHGIGTNVGLWRGHNALRKEIVGREDRTATETELVAMEQALERDMRAGALGLSTGLFYAPGSYAPTREVVRLARVAARHGGYYDSHIRDESTYSVGLLAAIDEVIEIGSKADLPAHIAHIKALGPAVAGQAEAVIARIKAARAAGVELTADQYPWLASGTRLSNALVPHWAQSGGRQAMLERLADDALAPGLLAEMAENLQRRGQADKLLITGDSPHRGMTLAEVAQALRLSPLLAAIQIIRAGDPAVASFMMTAEDVELFLQQPWVMTGSDGSPGHPRKYGTFPHKYQQYVRSKPLLSVAEFVYKSSGLVAATFNLCDRGLLSHGFKADIALWHPEHYRSNATYQQPEELASGVEYLLINGDFVIDGGELTGHKAGQMIYATDCRE
ncbi:MAG: M14 family zinc carboxypeptidase [Pseudomonadales bacterium]